MCRPVGGSREEGAGGHIGPPLRGGEKFPQPTRPSCVEASAMGRDGARPLRGGGAGRCVQERRGVVTPPYGSATGGAQQWADVGIGPYAPRGDEGRHAGSSCPTGGCGEPPRLPWVAAHSGVSAPAVARDGRGSEQGSPPKEPSTSGNPSVSLRLTAPFAQGSLWGRGYGLPRRFAPRNDSSDPLSFRGGPTGRRGNPFPFTMDGGSGCRT